MTSRRETVWLSGGGFAPVGIACLVAAVVFVFDVSLPLGVAGGVPYVALVLVGLWFPGIRVVYVLAVLGSVLTVAGYFLSASAVISWMVLTNRALALFAIWITAILVSLRTREMGNKNALVSLLHRATFAVNTAKGVEDAMQICLDEICAFTGWPIGHVYTRSEEHPGTMVPTTIWHIEDEARFANFRKVAQNTKFKAGEGLPGRILETKKAVWIRNVGEDPNFPRAKLTKDISSHAGFGVPVLFGDNVVAVLEFFSTEINDPDGAFLHVVANIGTHLGRLIERTRAEAALRASEERFRVFAESASDRFWEMDEGLRFTFHSGAPRVKSRFEPEETIGKTPWEIYGIDPDRDDHWRRHKEDLENHRPFRDFRHSFVDEGGQKYHWSVSGTPVFGKDGDFKGYSGTATNIGERVEAEEHLREAKEDAELANRAKSEFLSGMSHELRTPLNAIIGFSELIERESFGPLANDKCAEYVTDIHASGSHLLDLVNDILEHRGGGIGPFGAERRHP